MENPSLKQKISNSRALYSRLQNRMFLTKLYQVLEDPANTTVINWSGDGSKLLIKDTEVLKEKILLNFDRCRTLINFFRRLEGCRFFETYETDLGAVHVFEHLHLGRDKKPNTDLNLKKRSKAIEEDSVTLNKKVHKPPEETIQEDLAALMRFEAMLSLQVNQRVQTIKQRIFELDSDLHLSNQVKQLINTLQAERCLDFSVE